MSTKVATTFSDEIGELRDMLVAEYDVSPQQCETDVVEILGLLVKEGLVEAVA